MNTDELEFDNTRIKELEDLTINNGLEGRLRSLAGQVFLV
jgi:hypothetical protein